VKLSRVARSIAAVRPANAVLALIASLLVVVLAASGCGSDTDAEAPADFCTVARSSNLKCKEPTACDAQFGATCASLPKALSPSSIAAAKDCLESGVCGVASCVSRAARGAAPTPAHKKLAEDFCTFCAPNLPDCLANFYKRGSKSAGLGVLAYAEEVAQAVDDGCTGEEGCQARFQTCAAGIIKDKVGADVDIDTADCVITAFGQDQGEEPLGPDGKPQVVTCTPANCKGCCREDKCEKGDTAEGCGIGAKACELCSGAAKCLAGKCKEPCGPNNCPGCCDGDVCVPGASVDKCGEEGAACERCTGQFVCSNHICVDGSCLATCTTGCCSATGCKPGNTPTACGTGGEGCIDCGVGRKCASASCTLDTTSLWDVYISFAVVPDKDKKGAAWDLLNGAPDPYLLVFTSEGTSSHSGQTLTEQDTTIPVWIEKPVKGVKASELLNDTYVEIWDDDTNVNNDDIMGSCQLPITTAMFDQKIRTHTCPASATTVAFEVTFAIRAHTP
jgi:hypothetical protein